MWVLGISILLHILHCLLLHFADPIFLFDRYNEGICKTSHDFLVRNASLGSVYIMNLFSLSWDVSSNNGDIDNSLFVLNEDLHPTFSTICLYLNSESK